MKNKVISVFSTSNSFIFSLPVLRNQNSKKLQNLTHPSGWVGGWMAGWVAGWLEKVKIEQSSASAGLKVAELGKNSMNSFETIFEVKLNTLNLKLRFT